MRFSLRLACLFVTAACLLRALGASAQDQATSDAASPRPATQNTEQTIIAGGNVYKVETKTIQPTEFTIFADFIDRLGTEDLQIKAATEQGGKLIGTRTNYSRLMNIREDEEQDMWNIILDAFYRVGENDRQFELAVHEAQDASFESDPNRSHELETRKAALSQERPKIYQEAIVKLNQVLGAEAFNKLNAYVFRLLGKPGPIRFVTYVGPAGQNNPDGPDASRVQAVHP
jgi:hypothetical protein